MCERLYIAAMLVTHLWPHTVVAHICRNSVTFATEQSKLVIVPVASVTHTQLSKYKKLHSSQKFKLLTKVHSTVADIEFHHMLIIGSFCQCHW